jgi:protein-S-isoprenylcysteine O-methyltransferase Ste14
VTDKQVSSLYAVGQTLLLAAFAIVGLFVKGPLLFVSGTARVAGLGLAAIGVLLIFVAIRTLRAVVQIAPEPKPGGQLVTAGLYRWLRHPIYTGVLCAVIGLFLRRPTLLLAIGGAIVMVFLLAKTRFEERLLEARYPEYALYRARSWGVIPGLR